MEAYTTFRGIDVYWSDPLPSDWSNVLNWGAGHRGTLTTEHAVSSYGVPVLVDEAGHVYGPSDLPPSTTLKIAVSPTYTTPLIQAAQVAGYQVHSDGWGLGTVPPAVIDEML